MEITEKEVKRPIGHSIIRYRVRLYDRHFPWLLATKELYDAVIEHFFSVLKQEPELLNQSDFLLLRALETICIGTKEMKANGELPKYPLQGLPKIPLYFRRSAINAAIDLARKGANRPEPNMVLYKGMYQNFTDDTIDLKLYNGKTWVWMTYPFTGRKFPEEAEKLSPMLVLEKKDAWLEVPISLMVEDVRTVKERMQTEEHICAVSFPDYDVLAVAVILSKDGKVEDYHFFRGGKAKEHRRKMLLERIRISEESRGTCRENVTEKPRGNSSVYRALGDLNKHYAHQVSKRIIDYCLENNIKVLVVPHYETALDFRGKKYLKTDAYRWIGRSIIHNLQYKAFNRGIVVSTVKPFHIADCCSICGEKIRRYNEGHAAGVNYYGGRLFTCPNGHTGNTAQNTAVNVGKSFLKFYKK